MSSRPVVLGATVVLASLAACMAALLVVASLKPAQAALPAENGAIAFVRYSEGPIDTTQIWRMRPDGTRQRMLYDDFAPGEDPRPIRIDPGLAWSADGTRLAFAQELVEGDDYDHSYNDLFLMDPDGSNLVNLTNDATYDYDPSWYPSGDKLALTCGAIGQPPTQTDICSLSFDAATANVVRTNLTRLPTEGAPTYVYDDHAAVSPNGERIAFSRESNVEGDKDPEIYVIDADRPEGPDNPALKLTDNATYGDSHPDWSPNGKKIIYVRASVRTGNTDIFVMNANGTGKKNLTRTSTVREAYPAFSPDGRFIVFVSTRDGDYEIWRMRSDGSRQVQLTNNTDSEFSPDWQPRP